MITTFHTPLAGGLAPAPAQVAEATDQFIRLLAEATAQALLKRQHENGAKSTGGCASKPTATEEASDASL